MATTTPGDDVRVDCHQDASSGTLILSDKKAKEKEVAKKIMKGNEGIKKPDRRSVTQR